MRGKKLGILVLSAAVVGVALPSHQVKAASSWDMSISDGFANNATVFAGANVSVVATISKAGSDTWSYTGFQAKDNGTGVGSAISGNMPPSGTTTGATIIGITAGTHVFTDSVTQIVDTSTHTTGVAQSLSTNDTVTLNVKNHANAIMGTGTFSAYGNGPGGSLYTPVAPTEALSNSNHNIDINFGTIWATPSDNPYPVTATFTITNSLANSVSIDLSSITGGAVSSPGGTSPTWKILNSDGSAITSLTLAAQASKTLEIWFNTNDPSLYKPGNAFTAAWNVVMQENATGVTGTRNGPETLHITAEAVAVPLPPAVWLGASLLGTGGLIKKLRKDRATEVI